MSTDALDVWLSFNDLKRAGVVPNWQTLRSWQKDLKIGFPPGRLFGPNSRRWNKQHEIDPWLASRPTARSDFEDAAGVPDAS
jgi:hypothetical protein